jgi:molecular chaperone DnaJ
VIRHACGECRGHGMRQTQRKLKIAIPPGVDTGTRVRVQGEGQPGFHGGPNGDLYVFLKVKDHAFFEREDNDLHCTIPLNIAQAALGFEIDIPTLGEPTKLKIPEGTQNGAKFRFRHKGVAILNSASRGDLYVHVDVKIPAKLSREQRKLFEQLRDTLPVDNAPAGKGLFEKVKDYFM